MNNHAPSSSILEVRNLVYSYPQESREIRVLRGVHFQLFARERVALCGVSGVGKSTLLHLFGLLDAPQSGEILLRDGNHAIKTQELTDTQRTALRSHLIGFVYQFHYLLSEFTALENVMIPLMVAGVSPEKAKERARLLLERVNLEDRMTHRPSQLSGGQQQRVAIARALANEPKILLADEPTGNLDEHTAQDILSLFFTLSQEQGLSVVMATHNIELRRKFDRVVSLHEGLLTEVVL
jgi:lipoprotein-releasing system ATP-binding protein